MLIEKIRLLRDLVLVDPFTIRRRGSLFLLEERKFGMAGRVIHTGPLVLEVAPRDIVFWEPVSIDEPAPYFSYFYVSLLDEDGTEDWILIDEEAEPIIREAILSYRSNPATGDLRITTKDLNSQDDVRFLTSNIRDFGPVELTETGRLKTDYTPAYMIDYGWPPKTHYIFHESQILGRVVDV